MPKDLILTFEPPRDSLFLGCEAQLSVITTSPSTYDVELHLVRITTDTRLSLRVNEARRIEATVVDSVLDTFTQRLRARGWRLKP